MTNEIEGFTAEETAIILEAAYMALHNTMMFNKVAEHLDLSDDVLEALADKVYLHQAAKLDI